MSQATDTHITRRSLVAGVGAAIPMAAAGAAPDDPAQRLWKEWCSLIAYIDGGNRSNDETDVAFLKIQAIELEMRSGAPSLPKVAALVLQELYSLLSNVGDTIGGISPMSLEEDATMLAILRHLRPMIPGAIGRAVADVLDHPEQPFDAVLFARFAA